MANDIDVNPKALYYKNVRINDSRKANANIEIINNALNDNISVKNISPHILLKVIKCKSKKYKITALLNAPNFETTIRDTIKIYIDENKEGISLPIYAKIGR
jgi:hypothetical protein